MRIISYKRLPDEAAEINPKMHIDFTGGEALTSKLTILVAKYARKIVLPCLILTNGALINQNNVNEPVSLFHRFSISIDGSDVTQHDYYRGQGNYAGAKAGIELLKSRGAELRIAMVVTKKNMKDVSKMAEEWGEIFVTQPLFPLETWKSIINYGDKEFADVLIMDEPDNNLDVRRDGRRCCHGLQENFNF